MNVGDTPKMFFFAFPIVDSVREDIISNQKLKIQNIGFWGQGNSHKIENILFAFI
jgi:hypothetical protein